MKRPIEALVDPWLAGREKPKTQCWTVHQPDWAMRCSILALAVVRLVVVVAPCTRGKIVVFVWVRRGTRRGCCSTRGVSNCQIELIESRHHVWEQCVHSYQQTTSEGRRVSTRKPRMILKCPALQIAVLASRASTNSSREAETEIARVSQGQGRRV